MWELIGQGVSVLVTGFIGGVFGSFVVNPLVQFYDLRRRVRSRMHYIAPLEGPDLQNARDTLRSLSTDLLAFAETQPRVVKLLRQRGYEPELAARSLLGFSNSLAVTSGDKALFREQIEQSLKLPLSYGGATQTRHGG